MLGMDSFRKFVDIYANWIMCATVLFLFGFGVGVHVAMDAVREECALLLDSFHGLIADLEDDVGDVFF